MALISESAAALRGAIADASRGLVEREVLVELVVLAAVSAEHLLVIGPPGTAKSEAVRRVARALGGRYFEYLLGRFTEPSELFGPIDLKRLREGVVETQTAGMLPEAEIAFLDEIFLGSTAILNTLLGILNERTFRRGHTQLACPLRICVGAANALPQDEALGAFADRFLLRVFLEPVPDPRLEELLEGGWALQGEAFLQKASLGDIDALSAAARGADLSGVRPALAHLIRLLRGAGVALSDRRAVKVQRLVAAAAALAGRERPTEADLWPLVFAVPEAEGQTLARQVLSRAISGAENPLLSYAALEASQGPLARAARLVEAASAALSSRPDPADEGATEAWRLKLEGVAREIDAGFAPEVLPPDLAATRARLVDTLGSPR
jgi:MoxR-like ATPase